MSLSVRKLIVLSFVGLVFLLANALVVAGWLAERGLVDFAVQMREEFLTGTAITIIVVLLILLVPARPAVARLVRRCLVCNHVVLGGSYCSECGSRDPLAKVVR